MAKQGMSRPSTPHGPRNDISPVPQIQGKAKSGEKANPIVSGTTGANQKVWHESPFPRPMVLLTQTWPGIIWKMIFLSLICRICNPQSRARQNVPCLDRNIGRITVVCLTDNCMQKSCAHPSSPPHILYRYHFGEEAVCLIVMLSSPWNCICSSDGS